MSFFVTLTAVAIMLLYAVPGFLLVKTKLINESHIPSFSKLLMYVCQPCITVYSLRQMEYSPENFKNIMICLAITLFLQLAMIGVLFVLFKKKRNDIIWRIINLASVLANCAFLGIPILEALLPEHPEALAYSSVFGLSMSLIGWTVGMYIISLNKSYIKPKKIFLNPAFIGFAIALTMYLTELTLPEQMEDMITLLGRMSTPLCMMIMGMRLATVKIRDIFCDARQYISVVLKQIFFPLFAFALLYFLPISEILKQSVIILCACPAASMVQNFAELVGKGNDKAANMVLLGTITSVITVPLICLIL
jgi:predicted permease